MMQSEMSSDSPARHNVPSRATSLAMYLFLASLTMLFLASMVMYAVIRLAFAAKNDHPGFAVHLPHGTWISTVVLILGSFTIHISLKNLRRERLAAFQFYLQITGILAVAFLLIQTPCLWTIFREHAQYLNQKVSLYGLVGVLIVLHAAHVFGGVAAMVVTVVRARLGKYDHENILPIRNVALYWHFLDIIWLMMFGMFTVLG